MPILHKGMTMIAGRLPKVVKPRAHGVLDYMVIGSCLLAGTLFWKRNKRAALGSLVCAGATALNVMLTDYPAGKYPILSYQTHGSIDAGIAGLTAAMPRIMNFAGEPESSFFSGQALAVTAVTGLTDFEYYQNGGLRRLTGDKDVA